MNELLAGLIVVVVAVVVIVFVEYVEHLRRVAAIRAAIEECIERTFGRG